MNPFKYGQVVSNEDFCPRPELIKQLIRFAESGQNVVVQGERRMGKTSLIHEAFRHTKDFQLVYVDLLEIKTTDDLCRRLLKAIISFENQAGKLEKLIKSLSRLRPTISLDSFTGQPTVSLDPRISLEPDSIESVLDLISSMRKRSPVIVVFDEFQDVLNLPDSNQVLALLRSKIQFQGEIAYIFSGSIRNAMNDIFSNSDSPFFKSALCLDVHGLEKDDFNQFLKAKFRKGKRKISNETLGQISSIGDTVPGDIQELCGALWDTTSQGETISESNFRKAFELIFSREAKGYESVMTLVTGQQLKCLTGLARMGGQSPFSEDFLEGVGITHPASVQKALKRLVKLRVIYRYQGEYKFVNPFFKHWLLWKNY
jgi:uncharacterized protein